MKLNLIYYKNLADAAFEKLVASAEDMFMKNEAGEYVFCGGWSASKLDKMFCGCLREAVGEIAEPCTKTYDKYVIIGSCWPKDNLLLKFKDDCYFPKKLEHLLESRPNIKYLLRENDIAVDIEMLNNAIVSIFNRMFKSKDASCVLGEGFKNIFALSHSHLDCYALFKTVKWAYGNSNCVNVWKEKMQSQMQHLVAVNELIGRYVQKKSQMNRSYELKRYAKEVKMYMHEKLENVS